MEEIWKTIPGYEGLYEVSNFGQVKRIFIKTKLSAVDAEHIQNMLQQGISRYAIAKQFKVRQSSIFGLTKERRFSQRTPHLIRMHVTSRGYYRMSLNKNGKSK